MVSESARELAQTDPEPPICRRLEHVRRYFGFTSLRSFWLKLCEGWDEDRAVSYEAARKYHNKREPPVRYLTRISEVFGVRLAWMASEDGEMLKSEGVDGREELANQLSDRCPRFRRLDKGTQSLLVQIAGEYVRTAPDWREASDDVGDYLYELSCDLLWWATLPLRWHPWDAAWGFKGNPANTTMGEEREFVTSALVALRHAMDEAGNGRPLEEADSSIFRNLRLQMEAETDREERRLRDLEEELGGVDAKISRRE